MSDRNPQNMFSTVNRLGTTARVIFIRSSVMCDMHGEPLRYHRKDCLPSHRLLAEFHADRGVTRNDDVNPGTELDHAETLTRHGVIAHDDVRNDPPRE
jgi:hypothetical protein